MCPHCDNTAVRTHIHVSAERIPFLILKATHDGGYEKALPAWNTSHSKNRLIPLILLILIYRSFKKQTNPTNPTNLDILKKGVHAFYSLEIRISGISGISLVFE